MLFFPVLERHGRRTALTYLATMIFEVVLSNEMAYQVGQAGLAFGAVFLCVLLYRTRLVPRFLAGWGVAGYVIHFAGAGAEIFGVHVSLVLLVPGGLFELALGIWLLVRGFDRRTYGGRS